MNILQWIMWLFQSPFGQVATQASAAVLIALGKEGAALLSEAARRYVKEAEKTYGPGNGAIKFDAVKNRLTTVAIKNGIPKIEFAIEKITQDAATALQLSVAKKEK